VNRRGGLPQGKVKVIKETFATAPSGQDPWEGVWKLQSTVVQCVPRIYSRWRHGDLDYTCMEHLAPLRVRGRTLDVVTLRRSMADAAKPFLAQHYTDVFALGVGFLRCVSVLHAAGYVHTDVKYDNFLVNEEGRIVCADVDGVTRVGETPHVAPACTRKYTPATEQHRPVSFRQDLWAVLYNMVSLINGKLLERDLPWADTKGKGMTHRDRQQWMDKLIQQCQANTALLTPEGMNHPTHVMNIIREMSEALVKLDETLVAFRPDSRVSYERKVLADHAMNCDGVYGTLIKLATSGRDAGQGRVSTTTLAVWHSSTPCSCCSLRSGGKSRQKLLGRQ
jgi:serine/threonine protein kinase